MLNNVYLGGLQDIASSFTVTAQNTPAAQANMILAKPISVISLLVTLAGVFFMYFIPALFIVKGLISCVPIINNWVNQNGSVEGGSSQGGIKSYIANNWTEFLVGFFFAINAASGLCWSELSLISSGSAAVIQKVINASWDTADSPASIKQFSSQVNVYSDSANAQLYETYLKQETNMKQQLTNYVQSNAPDSSDMNYTRLRASYTAIVMRLQIIMTKLQKDGYAKVLGVGDSFFERHLIPDQSTSNSSGAYNQAFIIDSMVQSFQSSFSGQNSSVPVPKAITNADATGGNSGSGSGAGGNFQADSGNEGTGNTSSNSSNSTDANSNSSDDASN